MPRYPAEKGANVRRWLSDSSVKYVRDSGPYEKNLIKSILNSKNLPHEDIIFQCLFETTTQSTPINIIEARDLQTVITAPRFSCILYEAYLDLDMEAVEQHLDLVKEIIPLFSWLVQKLILERKLNNQAGFQNDDKCLSNRIPDYRHVLKTLQKIFDRNFIWKNGKSINEILEKFSIEQTMEKTHQVLEYCAARSNG